MGVSRFKQVRRQLVLRILSAVLMAIASMLMRASTASAQRSVRKPAVADVPAPTVQDDRVGTDDIVAASGDAAKVGLIIAVTVGAIVLLVIGYTLRARRRGYSTLGGNTVVRCREGHLFTTLWVPGASLKSVRLGMKRFQHCPVGDHWTIVTPVNDMDLTDEDRVEAARYHDVRII